MLFWETSEGESLGVLGESMAWEWENAGRGGAVQLCACRAGGVGAGREVVRANGLARLPPIREASKTVLSPR